MRALICADLGLMRYGPCLELMESVHAEVVSGQREPVFLAVEHEPVVTMGKRKLHGDLLFNPTLAGGLSGPEYFEIDRGGSATAHEPGQLVLYPIAPLEIFGSSVRRYVEFLEEGVIRTCASYGVLADRDPKAPGVWCGASKIAAVGVRVQEHVTKHGLAFNICNELRTFQAIIPCGLADRGVTTLESERLKQVRGDASGSSEATGVTEVLGRLLQCYESLSGSYWGESWKLERLEGLPHV